MDRPDDIRVKVSSILKYAEPLKPLPNKNRIRWVVTLSTLIVIVATSGFPAHPYITKPKGKITSPSAGSQTGRVAEIEGYTKNIPLELRHARVMVQIKDRGLMHFWDYEDCGKDCSVIFSDKTTWE